MKTVILDFVNVVADLDVKELISKLTIKEKFSALRLALASVKNGPFKLYLRDYQKGNISKLQLIRSTSLLYPQSSKTIPVALDALPESLHVNEDIFKLVKEIQLKGARVLLMSNSIPETEKIIDQYNLNSIFDGVILSTEAHSIKREKRIFEYAIKKFNINPRETIMCDDTKTNLATAESFGIETFHCKNSTDTCEILEAYSDYLDISKYDGTNHYNYSV